MTTKTHVAMFAIVTAIVLSLGVTPALQSAYASYPYGHVYDEKTVVANDTVLFDVSR